MDSKRFLKSTKKLPSDVAVLEVKARYAQSRDITSSVKIMSQPGELSDIA